MVQWRWRIVLAVIGLALLICSAYLVITSRLQIDYRQERETVPIEAPPTSWEPESRQGMSCIPLLSEAG